MRGCFKEALSRTKCSTPNKFSVSSMIFAISSIGNTEKKTIFDCLTASEPSGESGFLGSTVITSYPSCWKSLAVCVRSRQELHTIFIELTSFSLGKLLKSVKI